MCSKAMNFAAAVRAEPIPESACLTPRNSNGKRKLPPPAPLLAALFGPDYQTMSPDPRLPPFNERAAGTPSAAPSTLASNAAGTAAGPSELARCNSARNGDPASSNLPGASRQRLPAASLHNPPAPGVPQHVHVNVTWCPSMLFESTALNSYP
jgi:hypothetical protein